MADFSFASSSAYTPPASNEIHFTFEVGIVGNAAAAIAVAGSAVGAHGVAGVVSSAVAVAASAAGIFTDVVVTGNGAAAVVVSAAADGAQGVAGILGCSIPVSGSQAGAHGVAGTTYSSVSVSADGDGVRGVAGDASGAIGLSGSSAGIHYRYEVLGEVRDGGILVDRRVRIYARDTGALIVQGDTTAGHFQLDVGLFDGEIMAVPIDLSPIAADWAPPCANRVLPVLAQDNR